VVETSFLCMCACMLVHMQVCLRERGRERTYIGTLIHLCLHFTELLDLCFMLYEKPPAHLDKATVAEILYWIVKCGTPQSHLGLRLRKKYVYLY
jgi:hypothetical protein